jgi:hypothetical protein
MYFTIIRDNGFVKPFILSFSEIEEVSINESYSTFTYYKLSTKGLRKIKLSILNNVELKERFITLQGLLNDKRFIKKYDNVPEPSYKVIGYNGYSFIYGHSYSIKYMIETKVSKPKLNTKNVSYKNRFFGKVNKKVDFHKSNYKRK